MKVLAIDLDGTLLHSDKTLSDYTRQTIIRVQEQGMKVVIASGRPLQGIRPIANALQLQQHGGIVLAYNGAQIADCATGQLIYSKPMPPSSFPQLYAQAKQNQLEILSYFNQYIISEHCDHPYVQRSMHANKLQPLEVDDFVRTVQDIDIYKCMIVGNPDLIYQAEPKIQEQMNQTIAVFRSEPFYIECVPLGINKGDGLKRISNHLHIPLTQFTAFGDALNDIPMLRIVGTGVAMNNANPEVKAIATAITSSADEDGVAQYILQT